MSEIFWDRLHVMVVDDNRFVAKLVEGVLWSMGIKNVIVLNDAAEAITRLKEMGAGVGRVGLPVVDLVISDYMMPTVDGMLLLRWLRTGEGTPDRFVPFVMVSGAADRHVVQSARETGVTEFIAKPFSAASITERLLQTINNPRRFVLARGYFGPDRRRRTVPVEAERRSDNTDDIEVIRFRNEKKALRDNVRAVHFELPNRLREKLGPNAVSAPVTLDPALVEDAETRIQEMAGDYTDWVRISLDRMVEAHAALAVSPEGKDGAQATTGGNLRNIRRISSLAHELRGQGGIFDYPLVSSLAASLFRTAGELEDAVTPNCHKLIGAHIDAIRTVFKDRIKGNGGQVGRELLSEIAAAAERLS